MRVAVGVDHRGFLVKDDLLALLKEEGHDVLDLGTHSTDRVDYPDLAKAVGEAVRSGDADRGILVCGSGAGAVIAANKLRGIRCAQAHDTYTAHQCVEHDDANVLALGSGIVGIEVIREVVRAFLGAAFDGGERYRRRLDKVERMEQDRRASSNLVSPMLGRRPLLERRGIQNVLIATAVAIASYMLAPPLSPVLSDTRFPFLGEPEPQAAQLLTVGPLPSDFTPKPRPEPVEAKGLLMSGYTAGGSRFKDLVALIERTELNSLVIDIKDERGEISWIPRSEQARVSGAGLPKIVDPEATISYLKEKGIYVIGRIVTFQDAIYSKVRPDLAIRDVEGGIWTNYKELSWLDPYSTEAQDYNISLAIEAIELGFDEIQFDYIRFPTDGSTVRTWYPHRDQRLPHDAIRDFLKRAREQVVPRGAYISVDLFGLVALVSDDLGIGQRLELIAQEVDYVSLMTYPSHYNQGEYGIPDPEKEPYRTVSLSLKDAMRRIEGSGAKLRPWLQDFSLRVPYTPAEVRAQIEATEDLGINEWLLWNARNRYTEDALRPAPGARMPPPERTNVSR